LIGLKQINYESFLQITNDMIDRARHKEDYHIERIYRTINFHGKEGVGIDDLTTFLGVCGKHYKEEDIKSLINRIDPWKEEGALITQENFVQFFKLNSSKLSSIAADS
jgi:Ca2+-binding EF-hand superfamily protein